MPVQSYGGWALVTGASSGIGLAFADQLAAAGHPCLIVSNEEEALQRSARDIRDRRGVDVEPLCVDLAEPEAVDRIVAGAGSRDIGVVVSNASFGRAAPFEDVPLAGYRRIIAVNIDAYVALATAYVPRLRARERGALVFVSSINSLVPGIGHSAVYTATKAFETSLACGLWYENLDTGVDVLLVAPGPTRTGFQAEAGTKVASWAMEPEDVAAGALGDLGNTLLHVAGEPNRVLTAMLEGFALERRVEMASQLLDAALIQGTL